MTTSPAETTEVGVSNDHVVYRDVIQWIRDHHMRVGKDIWYTRSKGVMDYMAFSDPKMAILFKLRFA